MPDFLNGPCKVPVPAHLSDSGLQARYRYTVPICAILCIVNLSPVHQANQMLEI